MHSKRRHVREDKLRETNSFSDMARVQTVSLCLLLLTLCTVTLSDCGGSGNSSTAQSDPQISGNWQFTLSTTGDSFATSPLQGGFLLQKNGSITGQIEYSIVLPSQNGGANTLCNSGVATVTGSMSGNSVNLAAALGTLDASGNPATQTLTLSNGSLGANGATIQNGSYTVTAGFANVNGQIVSCGMSQDNGTWTATLVPTLTGGFQGFFHSTTSPSFQNQNFPVSGTFTQGANIGAATATITGTLLFQDPITLLNDYPCLTTASVNGTISGNTVLLQVISTSGTAVGQIGQTPGSSVPPFAVTFDNTQAGDVLHNLPGASAGANAGGYLITTKSCSGGDSGNLCLAFGSPKACSQPITLTPFALTFPAQLVGSAATSQTITLTNNTTSPLTGLSLRFADNDSGQFYLPLGGDFNGVTNFSEKDTCSQQGTLTLDAGSSCVITVSFSPQESCPWLPQLQNGAARPDIKGAPPSVCPLPVGAVLTVTVPSGSVDADNEFSVPVTGTGLSRIVPLVPEIDFGAEAVGEASPPQTLTFSNQSLSPVTILPAQPCTFVAGAPPAQPRPPLSSSGQALVGGIQLAETGAQLSTSSPILADQNVNPPLVNAPTVDYFCETDPPSSNGGSGLPNFQISNDGCSGQTLAPYGQSGNSCSLEITFVPQPATWSTVGGHGLDDFVQLNTMWCGDTNNPAEPNCEVDSGRFPVEIKTNSPSPLRISPSAGMDFGSVIKGTTGPPLTVTIFNDPVDPMAGAVSFTSKLVTGTDYLETDNCPATLPSNQSCTITVAFTPKVVGLDPGNITLTYSISSAMSNQIGLTQTILLRGTGQ